MWALQQFVFYVFYVQCRLSKIKQKAHDAPQLIIRLEHGTLVLWVLNLSNVNSKTAHAIVRIISDEI